VLPILSGGRTVSPVPSVLGLSASRKPSLNLENSGAAKLLRNEDRRARFRQAISTDPQTADLYLAAEQGDLVRPGRRQRGGICQAVV
jgi:hypothetical protein